MHKFRVSLDLDLGAVAPDEFDGNINEVEVATNVVSALLLESTRKVALESFRELQNDSSLSREDKSELMAAQLRKVMLTLQAQLNMTVDKLPDNTEIQTELPFERQMAA